MGLHHRGAAPPRAASYALFLLVAAAFGGTRLEQEEEEEEEGEREETGGKKEAPRTEGKEKGGRGQQLALSFLFFSRRLCSLAGSAPSLRLFFYIRDRIFYSMGEKERAGSGKKQEASFLPFLSAHLFEKSEKKEPPPTTATLSSASSSKAFLTTKNGLIVDQSGKEVVMKGINWFGWNTNLDATGEKFFWLFFLDFFGFSSFSRE